MLIIGVETNGTMNLLIRRIFLVVGESASGSYAEGRIARGTERRKKA